MSHFLNPFRPDPRYYRRNFVDCLGQFLKLLVGYFKNGSANLGLLDYLLIIPALSRLLENYKEKIPWIKNYDLSWLSEFNVFLIAPKFIISVPIIVLSAPFLYLYNEFCLYLGKPILKSLGDLEALPIKSFDSFELLRRDTPPNDMVCRDILELIMFVKFPPVIIVRFENDDIYYLESDSKKIIKIDPSLHPESFANLSAYMQTNIENNKDKPFYRGDSLEVYKWILQMTGSYPISEINMLPLEEDKILNEYYDKNASRRCLLKDQPHFFEQVQFGSLFLNTFKVGDNYVLGLGGYDKNRPNFLIVPSRENAAIIETIIRCGEWIPDHDPDVSINLQSPFCQQLTQEDPFKKEEGNRQQRRCYTPVYLLKALSQGVKSQAAGSMYQIYEHVIAEYADLTPLHNEREITRTLLIEEMTEPFPISFTN